MTPVPARVLRVLGALAGMCLGSTGVLALVITMNEHMEPPKAAPREEGTTFDVPPPPPPPQARPSPPPERKPRPRPNAAAPALATSLAGMSFGLPGFADGAGAMNDSLLGDMGDVVMSENAVDSPPRLLNAVHLEYPVRARSKNIEGAVVVSVVVGVDGVPRDAKVLEAQPSGVFEESALAAVGQMRFEPASYEGRPVSMRARQRVLFQLD